MAVRQPQPLSALLRQYRLDRGLTQEELAERARISERSISDLERGRAQRPHRDTIRRLADALGLSPEERAWFEAEARGVRVVHPFTVVPDTIPPTTLPDEMNSFVGRDHELEKICALLQRPEVRLLTLLGTGGAGKTRLAVRAGRELQPVYLDGVHFVALAPLSDPRDVVPAVAAALGVLEASRQALIETVRGFLRGKRLLLILDNFEHLLGAAGDLRRLLEGNPDLRVLVTSRAPLHLYGEHELPVRPLPLPDLDHLPPPDALPGHGAVALFLDRARAVDPDFNITEGNAPAIAEICARLDGLPLAIELAAPRLRVFTPQALLGRLTPRLSLLTGGAIDLPGRQQTLRGAIDWSYELLRPADRTVLDRLAVFAGGCTLEAAEAICALPEEPAGMVLESVTTLVEHSLVRREDSTGRETRFLLLETIREYAAERLEPRADALQVRRQHADYFAALAAQEEACRDAAERQAWCDRVEREHDNIRTALRWFVATDGEGALRLALHLSGFWHERWYFAEGHRWLEEALGVARDAPRTLRLWGLRSASNLAFHRGEYDASEAFAAESLVLARETEDDREIAYSFMSLAPPIKDRGEHDRAERIIEEGLALLRACGDMRGVIGALHLLGEVALNREDYGRAVEIAGESVELAREVGARRFLVMGLDNFARALLCHGDLDRAARLWIEGAQLSVEYRDRTYGVYYLEGLAGVAARRDRPELAATLAGAALATRQEINEPRSGPEAEIIESFLAPARACLDSTGWETAWAVGEGMSFEDAISYALSELSAR